jgi:hypothetical protein
VRMAARGHVAGKPEGTSCRNIEFGAGVTAAASQLATGDQDRAIGEARSCGELMDLTRVTDMSECSDRGIVDLCIVWEPTIIPFHQQDFAIHKQGRRAHSVPGSPRARKAERAGLGIIEFSRSGATA